MLIDDELIETNEHQITSKKVLQGTFILLSTGNTKILLPKDDVGEIIYLSKTEIWHPLSDYQGIYFKEKVDGNLYLALSDKLKPTLDGISDKSVAMAMAHADQNFMWCWQSAQVLMDVNLPLIPLPEIAVLKGSPITHLVEYDNQVIFPCRADKLVDFALSEESE